jgi:hypothetical protein
VSVRVLPRLGYRGRLSCCTLLGHFSASDAFAVPHSPHKLDGRGFFLRGCVKNCEFAAYYLTKKHSLTGSRMTATVDSGLAASFPTAGRTLHETCLSPPASSDGVAVLGNSRLFRFAGDWVTPLGSLRHSETPGTPPDSFSAGFLDFLGGEHDLCIRCSCVSRQPTSEWSSKKPSEIANNHPLSLQGNISCGAPL